MYSIHVQSANDTCTTAQRELIHISRPGIYKSLEARGCPTPRQCPTSRMKVTAVSIYACLYNRPTRTNSNLQAGRLRKPGSPGMPHIAAVPHIAPKMVYAGLSSPKRRTCHASLSAVVLHALASVPTPGVIRVSLATPTPIAGRSTQGVLMAHPAYYEEGSRKQIGDGSARGCRGGKSLQRRTCQTI